MRFTCFFITLFFATLHSAHSYGQDTIIPSITNIPLKFITQTNNKIDKYSNRITSKTEKTLEKLTKWENKIHKLLDKASPETAQQLFGEGKLTFASMLQKIQERKTLVENSKAKYDEYRDKLTTNIKYIETQQAQLSSKYIQPLKEAKQKAQQLEEDVTETETAQALIKERKKQLLTEAYKVLGKSKYLTKINKEAYYYTETLKNYKELFNDTKKAEQKALELLGNIPAVKDFVQQNSMLASLFGNPSTGVANNASLAGLQTRAGVNALIQGRIAAGGPNAAAQISANVQAAQGELTKLKDKILKAASSKTVEGEDGMPSFKKSETKSKTFKQRLEIGSNMQFGKPNIYTGSQADLAMSVGYKLNDKSIVGVGLSYKIDYGSVDNFYVRHGGVGLRSFMDWKLKKQFFLSGGYEMNYNNSFKNFASLINANGSSGIGNAWQSSGLIGISKKISFSPTSGGTKGGKTKWVKGTKLQLLYDFLYNSHVVPTQPVVFRVGYNF
jgi:hypothetical protein